LESGVLRLVILITIALVIAVALSSQASEATRELLSDDFTQVDGSPPNTTLWTTQRDTTTAGIAIENGSLRTNVTGTGEAYVRSKRDFSSDNLTLRVDYMTEKIGLGSVLDIVVMTYDDGSYDDMLALSYERPWYVVYYVRWGSMQTFRTTGGEPLVEGTWYSIEVKVLDSEAVFDVNRASDGEPMWSSGKLTMDPLKSRNGVMLGVRSIGASNTITGLWDNFTLVDPTRAPNTAPEWLPVPTLTANEEEPYAYSFTSHVQDDQELWELSITSSSSYVVTIEELRVTFKFPAGLTDAVVALELHDGYASTSTEVHFVVQDVNLPPEHNIPGSLNVLEGVPTIFDLGQYIWDPDNVLEELFIIEDSPYATTHGLVLNFTAPEGMRQYELRLRITDGVTETGAIITIRVTPYNNPPEVAELPELTLDEDEETHIDLRPYVSDPDTPLASLTVVVYSFKCTVNGLTLTFLYDRGGLCETVVVEVKDEASTVRTNLTVYVQEVNDPPVIEPIPEQGIWEEEEEAVSLTPFISDEDNLVGDLTIECDYPHLVDIDGLVLYFYHNVSVELVVVEFIVHDLAASTSGSFELVVHDKNDPPVITGVGDFEPPVIIQIDVDFNLFFPVHVHDEDDATVSLYLDSLWDGAYIDTGRLYIDAGPFSIGEHDAIIGAVDQRGLTDELPIKIVVVDPTQEPIVVTILLPENHTIVDLGVPVVFDIDTHHSRLSDHSLIIATWTSDLQGPLRVSSSEQGLDFTTSDLDPGVHTITVTVTSGDYSGEAWFTLTVGEEGEEIYEDYSFLYIVIIVIIILIIIASITLSRGAAAEPRPQEGEDQELPEQPSPPRPAPEAAPRQAPTARWPPRGVVPPVRQQVEDRYPFPVEERLQVELAPDIERLIEVIESMPGGIPRSLNLFDAVHLANRIIKGKKMTAPDGLQIVKIFADWYYFDPEDRERFLKICKKVF
jgi:hypothetical protein